MTIFYEERRPIIEAVLQRLGRAATEAELFEEFKGDGRFGKPRRIGATVRCDKWQRHPVFVRQGNRIALRRSL